MSNYKKFSLDTIKQKLKNGEYAAPVGAMRAIGKTQELSEADKEKARKLVRAHFGIEEGAPAKVKKAAKKAAKKVAKKVARKAAAKAKAAPKKKKAPKKAATAPAVAPKAVAKKATKKASKRARSTAASASEGDTGPSEAPTKSASSVLAPQAADSKGAVLTEMGEVVATMSESLKAMEAAKRMFPKASLERNVEMVTGAMTRAVRVIDEEVTKPRLGESSSAPSEAPARKKPSKKGTRAKATTTPPPADEVSEAAPAPNGVHDEDELSEEEQEQLRLARETQQQQQAD